MTQSPWAHYLMAVCEIARVSEDYAWHKMPLAVGLQYHSMWWEKFNMTRQITSTGKVPEIQLLRSGKVEEDSLVV